MGNVRIFDRLSTDSIPCLSVVGLALLLAFVCAIAFCGCSTSKPKSLIMAYPNYFEINAGATVPVALDKENVPKVIPADMFCYDAQAQNDVLAAKKGVK